MCSGVAGGKNGGKGDNKLLKEALGEGERGRCMVKSQFGSFSGGCGSSGELLLPFRQQFLL